MKQAANAIESRAFGQDIANAKLFFTRWIKNPLRMGSVVPSSRVLCRHVAAQARALPDEAVIELGAGTGVVTRELLRSVVPPERLFVIEIEHGMASHLRQGLPDGVNVIEGDARRLPSLIPPDWHGKIGTVVLGIPLMLLPLAEQRRFVDSIEAVAPGRGFILYTYAIASPLPWKKLGLVPKREAWTPLNVPPASVWRYTPR